MYSTDLKSALENKTFNNV